MRNILKNTFLICVSLLYGCQNDDLKPISSGDNKYTEEVAVGISFKATSEEIGFGEMPPTRAGANTTDDVIKDVWVFQFDGLADDSRFIGTTHYTDLSTGSGQTSLVNSEGYVHRLVFIANTHDGTHSWNMTPGQSTYKDMVEKCGNINSETDLIEDGTMGVVMSGKFEGVINASTTLTNIPLTRSVAKVALKLILDGTQTEIQEILSVQLCNVPNSFNFADALNTGRTSIYPQGATYFNYDAVTEGLPKKGNTDGATFQWYMPRNAKGIVNNNLPSQKNNYAPTTATYFLILAKDHNNVAILYRLYPGANMISDFNVDANKRYTLTFTIKGSGNTGSDGRVEDFGNVNYVGKSSSNCYILNPPPAGFAARTYTIPVARVDEYWGDVQYVGNIAGSTHNALGNSGDWVVALYWQDKADIVRASDPTKIQITKSSGTGSQDHFTIAIPTGVTFGNFVVAISKPKADGGGFDAGRILWSWHFWVTDYNPYRTLTPITNTYVYNVSGGSLHRYEGTMWQAGGEYANKFIMDRNIGTPTGENYEDYPLYYQFGRKDPFPSNISLYDINGTALTTSTTPAWNGSNANATTGPQTINWAINNPLKYITENGWVAGSMYKTDGSPTGQTTYDDNTAGVSLRQWHDPKIANTDKGKKSIFDPSPWGFKVPRIGTWGDFRLNTAVSPTTNINGNTNRVFPTDYSNARGFLYWPYIELAASYPILGTIYYPASGYRYYSSATIDNAGLYGCYWSSSPNNTTSSGILYFRSSELLERSNVRTSGYSVRPVQE